MKRIAYLAACILIPLASGQDTPAPELAAPDAASAASIPEPVGMTPTESAASAASPVEANAGTVPNAPSPDETAGPAPESPEFSGAPEAPGAKARSPEDATSSATDAPMPAAVEEEPIPVEILMASKELALSDTAALLKTITAAGTIDPDLPSHVAVVQRFNDDMQLLALLLSWVESKEDADLVAAAAGMLCRRGVELVSYFETEIAPQLTEEQELELSSHMTSEQKQALSQVFQTLMEMMQTGFFGSDELKRATAPLLKSMLGVPSV